MFTERGRQSRGTLPATQKSPEPTRVTTCEESRVLWRSVMVTATASGGFQSSVNHAGETLHSYAISERLDQEKEPTKQTKKKTPKPKTNHSDKSTPGDGRFL